MDMNYLKEFYDNNKKTFDDYELDINSLNDLVDYLCSTLKSNFQYDFGIDIDTNRLFNLEEKDNSTNKDNIESVELEK